MVFCHEWVQAGDGRVCAIPLAEDLRAAAGEPVILFSASEAPWTAPLRNQPPGSYVTDGPWVFRHGSGGLSMLWSSFDINGKYRIGQTRSERGILGPWKQAAQPAYTADAGHGMLFTALDGARYLAIHSPNTGPNERPAFVGVDDSGQWLTTNGSVLA